jgi:transcriptional regulator with XRE-family HTH domain
MKSNQKSASHALPAQPTPASIAHRIRTLRLERGWSLADVERLSRGSLKAVVLGSYERGDRALSLARTIDIARIFSIPLQHLLVAPEKTAPTLTRTEMMVDLRRTRTLSEDLLAQSDPILKTFSAFLAWIATRRCDWNGEIMSLRFGDLSTLSIMTLTNEETILSWLNEKGLLVTELNHP